MKLSTLSPAERMKASGLVGLIIVVLFFVVHTLLGSVSPKKLVNHKVNGSAVQGVPGPPPPINGASPTDEQVSLDEAFPMKKARQSRSDLDRSVSDPFIQINDGDDKANIGGKPIADNREPEPAATIRQESRFAAGAGPGGSVSLPGLAGSPFGGAGTPAPAQVLVAKPEEPEIKLIGIVWGDAAVATLSVNGEIRIARAGDVLSKGYRLMQINEDGVKIRHGREFASLRSGMGMNSPSTK